MRFRNKLVFGLVIAALAVVAVAASVATASSSGTNDSYYAPWDPQTTNVPYLAWNGEQVRVEKCLRFADELTDAQTSDIRAKLSISFPGTFTIEDWSGVDENNAGPRWLGSGANSASITVPVEINQYGICWSAHLTSQKPGLTVVKLAVELQVLLDIQARLGGDAATSDLLIGLDNVALFHDVLMKHQFLTIFMTPKAPSLYEVSDKDYFGGWGVADPAGDGIFSPPYDQGIDTFPGYGCYDNAVTSVGADGARSRCHFNDDIYGLVKIDVKGTFPMKNDFAGMFTGDLVTLPDQWEALAHKLAVDDYGPNGSIPGSAYARWDIHDNNDAGHALYPYHPNKGLSAPDGTLADHFVDSGCDGIGLSETTDAVDNCIGGGQRMSPFANDAEADFYGEYRLGDEPRSVLQHLRPHRPGDRSVRSRQAVGDAACSTASSVPGTLRCRHSASTSSSTATSVRSTQSTRTTST